MTERAAELLREARPASVDAGALVREALIKGRARHRARGARRLALAAGAGAALACAAAWIALAPASLAPPRPPPAELVRFALASRDRVVATGDARFDVESDTPALRRLHVARGAMLFDVAPLPAGERFEVRSEHATVSVVGTVFAVEVTERGTRVEVFEGRVRIEDGRGSRALETGGRYDSSGSAQGSHGGLARLRASGWRAARRRPARTQHVASAEVGRAERVRVRAQGVDPARAPAALDALADDGSRERPALRRAAPERSEGRSERAAPSREALAARIAAGEADQVLRTAQAQAGAAWRLVEGDALRALGRHAEAAGAYDRAADGLRDGRMAAFLAATERLRRLNDAGGALASLDRADVCSAGSPLRERALALRGEALARLGRRHELQALAREYLAAFPDGSRAGWMRRAAVP
ncbi:MAG: FecR domain-containing protein [Sandaracinaceae bacterium]|nr:FecR domain-containing protein [Sandaracinaceae bacterium]